MHKATLLTGVVLLIAIAADAGRIYSADFTSGTYGTGGLDGQDGWDSQGSSIIAGIGVTENGYAASVNGASNNQSAVANGETYESTITFNFNDLSGGLKSGPIIGAAIFNGNTVSSTLINGVLKSQNSGAFRLSLHSNWGNVNTSIGIAQSPAFPAAALGLTYGEDTASDQLSLSLSMTAGMDATSWNATVSLYNGATQILTWTPTSSNLRFDASTVYGGFVYGQSDSNQSVGDRVITSYGFSSTNPKLDTLGLITD